MRGSALAIVLLAAAFTYWRPLRRVRIALGFHHLVATGHVFLVLGFLLGLVLGDNRLTFTEDLSPIVALVAGWTGFATGMRFDMRILRTVPRRAFVVALAPAVSAGVVIGGGAALLLRYWGAGPVETGAASLVIAAVAASSGPTLVSMIRARRPGRSSEARPVLRMIEFAAGVDDLLVVFLAMIAFAFFRTGATGSESVWWLLAATGGGALLGVVTWLFLGGKATQDERLLLGIGMLVFIAGFAGWLYFSPAAVAAIAAMVLVNLPGHRMAQLFDAVRRVERPAVILLMAVIGFHLTGKITWIFFPLVFALTTIRLFCKRFAGALVSSGAVMSGLRTGRHWADGLAPQGTLSLLVALAFFHVWQDDLSRTVLAAVTVASVINETIAPWLFLRLLRGITGEKGITSAGRGEVA